MALIRRSTSSSSAQADDPVITAALAFTGSSAFADDDNHASLIHVVGSP
jgi:hypothetical protein